MKLLLQTRQLFAIRDIEHETPVRADEAYIVGRHASYFIIMILIKAVKWEQKIEKFGHRKLPSLDLHLTRRCLFFQALQGVKHSSCVHIY